MMHQSMYRSTRIDKGLVNNGENNCFLNVVIQSLWHLSSFRRRFCNCDAHEHVGEITPHNCAHCALQVIFTQYRYSDENRIPPNALRVVLHVLFNKESKFQLGQIDDAAEALDAVLTALELNTPKNRQQSISKEVFGIDVSEFVCCPSCSSKSEPINYSNFIFYSYVTGLLELQAKSGGLCFEDLLYTLNQENKSCTNEACTIKPPVTKMLNSHPYVFSIGLVWSTADPSANEIFNALQIVQQEIDLDRVFRESNSTKGKYKLRGMICYYGKHYYCYFYSEEKNTWLVFDDAAVVNVGPHWSHVVDKCRRGRFHPSVLFYEQLTHPVSKVAKATQTRTNTNKQQVPVQHTKQQVPVQHTKQQVPVQHTKQPVLNAVAPMPHNSTTAVSPKIATQPQARVTQASAAQFVKLQPQQIQRNITQNSIMVRGNIPYYPVRQGNMIVYYPMQKVQVVPVQNNRAPPSAIAPNVASGAQPVRQNYVRITNKQGANKTTTTSPATTSTATAPVLALSANSYKRINNRANPQ